MSNYFELYDIPVSFHPDAAKIKTKFYELSRQYHPDKYTQADSATQAEVLRMSAMNNQAYKTLNSADATMAYILRINELLEDEEKYNLPAEFLMEMMDLNEVVSEYEMETENEEIKVQAISALENQFRQWDEEVTPLTKNFDGTRQNKELLLQIKDYYFRKKYLLRIQGRIQSFSEKN